MTSLLERAFEAAAALPPLEQDALAAWLLAEIESELRWQTLFDSSKELLERMADEALAEHHSGHTQVLDPDLL